MFLSTMLIVGCQVMESDEARYDILEPQRHADGKQAWLNTSKAPLHDGEGHIVGIMGCYDDVTERVEQEQQIRHDQKIEAWEINILRGRGKW